MKHSLGVIVTTILVAWPTAAARPDLPPQPVQPGTKKVVLYAGPQSPLPDQVLEGLNGEVVQRYERYTVIRVNDNAIPALLRRAGHARVEVVVADHFDRIFHPSGVTDARLGTDGSHPGQVPGRRYAAGREGLWVAQFAGPILPEWQDRVAAAGATIYRYVQMNALLLVATEAVANRISRDPAVQYIDIFQPYLKAAQVTAPPNSERDYIIHLAASASVKEDIDRLAAWAARPLEPQADALAGELRFRAQINSAQIPAVLSLPLVVGISEPLGFNVSDERAAAAILRNATNDGQLPPYKTVLAGICSFCADLSTEGFRAGVADLGFNNGSGGPHHEVLPGTRIVWGQTFIPTTSGYYSATLADKSGHGTMVAAVIAGDPSTGTDSGGYLYGMGVAPSAGLVVTAAQVTFSTSTEPATPTSIFSLAADAYQNGALVQNHSYNTYTQEAYDNEVCGTFVDGQYTQVSQTFDAAVIDAESSVPGKQAIALTTSSGNITQQPVVLMPCSGKPNHRAVETLPPATAKNVIAVGGAENERPDPWTCRGAESASFSNIMKDSKRSTIYHGGEVSSVPYIKPDLFAPASNITSLRSFTASETASYCSSADGYVDGSGSASPYRYSTGTSFAAPQAAGAAVLASRRYAETVRGAGNPDARAAKPSLIKAMLIAGAKTMYGGTDKWSNTTIGALPNALQGFGRLALDEVLSSTPARIYINESEPLTTVGTSWSGTYRPSNPSLPVKIALVWSDPPAEPTNVSGTPLVNDLDLYVERGTPCVRHVGNSLSWTSASAEISNSLPCTATGIDHANNVELIKFMTADVPFTVTVRAQSGAMTTSAPQAFSLVVYNAVISTGTPPAAPASVAAQASLNGSWSATVSWPRVEDATSYEVFYSVDNQNYVSAGTVSQSASPQFVHPGLAAAKTYLYKVEAINAAGRSPKSSFDWATTVHFAATLTKHVTPVAAAHMTELRAAVDAFRVAAGLGAYSYSEAIQQYGLVKASHLTQLRTALVDARGALNLPALTITDSTVQTHQTTMKSEHINELRDAVR